LALIKRAREVILGAPGLAVWLWIEARGWRSRHGKGQSHSAPDRALVKESRN
jgi:hypothetical protein